MCKCIHNLIKKEKEKLNLKKLRNAKRAVRAVLVI